MATSHFFNNRIVKLPGAYSAIKSVSPVSFSSASYSKVLIINTDPAQAFGGSVNGELTKGSDALYKFNSIEEARAFFKSGYLWYLAGLVFKPSNLEGRNGCSQLQFINALTSTAPTITFSLSTSGASLVLKVKDESTNGNGVKKNASATSDIPSTNLKSGYAACIEAGVKDSTKYIIKIYQGSYKGVWSGDNLSYDGIDVDDARPELVIESPEVATVKEFVDWANSNEIFSEGFVVSSSADGAFASADITANKFLLASGGTATYAATDLTAAENLLVNGDFSIVLSNLKADSTGADTIHASLQYFCQSMTRFPKYLAVGASDTFATAINEATAFNSERVWCIYGKPRFSTSLAPLGYRVFDSVAMAALVVGRIAGLAPQIPGTFKELAIAGIDNDVNSVKLEEALDAGLMTVNYDDDLGNFVITRAINTLQKNTSLQNPDGSTFSIQISRICTQLNTDVVVNAKIQIFGSNETANIFTVSAIYLKNWIKSFLASKIATEQQDNLIIGVEDVSVERQQDAYYATYRFQTNSEIAFVFFTGIAIN